jgi:hypothetical protein
MWKCNQKLHAGVIFLLFYGQIASNNTEEALKYQKQSKL